MSEVFDREDRMSEVFDQERVARKRSPNRPESPGVTLLTEPGARYEPFPLTDVQKAYWLGRSNYFELGNVGCHVYFEFDVSEADRGRMQAGWQKLIDRHDMLRAVVRSDGMQQVLPHTPHYEIKHLNLRRVGEDKAQSELQAIRHRMSHQVYPPDRWPLFELRTTELEGQTVLHFSLDLLFVDLWSMQLLFNEWTQLTLESDTYLAPLEISFRDYVLATFEHRGSEGFARAERYWLQRLDTLPAAPQLPLVKTSSALTQSQIRSPGGCPRARIVARAQVPNRKSPSDTIRRADGGICENPGDAEPIAAFHPQHHTIPASSVASARLRSGGRLHIGPAIGNSRRWSRLVRCPSKANCRAISQ